MDRITLKTITLACIALATAILFSACPMADPLELRDEIEERVAAAGMVELPQLSILQGTTGIADGAVFDIGSTVALTTTDVLFTISNPSNIALNLTGVPSVAITGTNQSEFSIQLTPATPVSAQGTSTFALRFSPATAGIKTATLTITNNSAISSFSFTVTATATDPAVVAPQISLKQEGSIISNGATFDIGTAVALTTKDVLFTISNSGNASLNLTGIPPVAITGANQAEFSLQITPATPISAQGTSTFALRFSPTTAGAKTVTLTLTNNSATSSFSFTVTATATDPAVVAPQIALNQEGSVIGNGSTFDIGTAVALTTKDVLFTISNPGNASLNLTGTPLVAITGTNQAEFSIQVTPATPVSALSTSTFSLRFSPTSAGAKTVTLTLTNNSATSSFSFTITATAQDIVASQIVIKQGSTGIGNGSSFDIGPTVALTNKDVVFSISNPGNASLNLTGTPLVSITGTNQAEFSIQVTPATPVSSLGTTTFTLRFSPTTPGAKTITLLLTNNSATSSFSFTVVATAQDVIAPTGNLSIASGSAYINSINTSLTIAAVDTGGGTLSQMLIGNESSFSGMSWEPYATSRVWSVSAGDAVKTVYIRFKDNSGNISSIYSDTITLDTISPNVLTRSPAASSVDFIRSNNIIITFSENINPASITTNSFKVMQLSNPVPGAFTVSGSTVTFNPAADLRFAYSYEIILTSAITDMSGLGITNPAASTFIVEDDIYEGLNGNQTALTAFDLTNGITFVGTPIIPFQKDLRSARFPNDENGLAILKNFDLYHLKIAPTDIPETYDTLVIQVYFSGSAGELVPAGSDDLRMVVTYKKTDNLTYGFGINQDNTIDFTNKRLYTFNLMGIDNPTGDFYINVYLNGSYITPRLYNLAWNIENRNGI